VAFTAPPPPSPAAKPARTAATATKPPRTAKRRSRPATAPARPAASPPAAATAQAAASATPHHTLTTAHPVAGLAGNVAPQYTPAETRRREQGTVVLHIQVSPDGRPVSVTVGSSSGYSDLDATARMTVLADWRFVPATVDGNPVPGYCFVSIHFTLRDEDQ
jgi:protein TonB